MRVVKFAVRNYRSITDTPAIELADWTVLVGPNNEGKSNLVRALATGVRLAQNLRPLARRSSRAATISRSAAIRRAEYNWAEDYPLQLQKANEGGETVFRLWFRLTPAERRSFYERTGSRLNVDLPVEIRVGAETQSFKVPLQGPAARTLSKKREEIASFLSESIDFEHIPAVRTADVARTIVAGMVESELAVLEEDEHYQEAVEAIKRLQKPVLDKVGSDIHTTLSEFLPTVRQVTLQIPDELRAVALRSSIDVIVDDGRPTPLSFKGDGVQSIAALSLMRAASRARAGSKDLILAIEEPEAHLHPGASRRILGVLKDIARSGQIIMTTHDPVFVDRGHPANNIIVEGSKAHPARSIDEIRDLLGVQASDNLRNADLALLVEGLTDADALRALLPIASPTIAGALDGGRLTIISAGGCNRLAYHASLIRNSLCELHAFFDYDAAGRGAAHEAITRGDLLPIELQFANCRGRSEAEIEDMYDPAVYADAIFTQWGVRIPSPAFDAARGKWSSRMGAAFQDAGRDWETASEAAKVLVARSVAADPENALSPRQHRPLDALVRALEERLGN